jgi:hypothetical protein
MRMRTLGIELATTAALFSGCAVTGPDSSDSYEVIARVDEVNNESFGITDITIVEANGSAESRLSNGEVIHDNYQSMGCVGKETSNDFDEEVDAGRLMVGSIVRVRATVGTSKVNCTSSKDGYTQDRSILESLDVIEP